MPTVLGGGTSTVYASTFLPLGWASGLCFTFETRGGQYEARAAATLRRMDALLYATATGTFIAVLVASGHVSEGTFKIVAHTFILAGLAVAITLRFSAANAAAVVTVLVLITSTYSPRLAGARFVRIMQPDGSLSFSFLCGMALLGVGLLCLLGDQAGPRKGRLKAL